MCTLTIAWRVFDGVPIVVAANRDEAIDRPSVRPGVVQTDPHVVAPTDEQAGGTWIGYNEHGVFAGITNRWVDPDLGGDRSRGLLVRDALDCSSAADAAEVVEAATRAEEYAGFNLLVADAADAVLFEWDGDFTRHDLAPGVHVVVNVGFDDTYFVPDRRPEVGREQADNARRVRADLEPRESEGPEGWLDRARAVLRDHDYGVCVHGDGFGTRSSSLITVPVAGDPTYEFAPGPPCETEYDLVSPEGQV